MADRASPETKRRDAPLEPVDLTTSNTTDDDTPPPAYGDTYGEIRAEKEGLGTSALVTDDGRVNIRVSQLNRRLSQVFAPALRVQVNNAQDTTPPPPPYIPPSLGGAKEVPPPPSLNVVIQVVGSRGDVQPFIALGKVLKNTYGHRVRLATHPVFRDFVQENGLEFFSIGGDPSRLMAFMVKNPGLMPGFSSLRSGDVGQRRNDVAEYIQGCWRSCYQAGDGMDPPTTDDDRPFVADCIIANPPSFAHIHCAEKLGVPLHIMFTMPYSPTQAFPHPLANIQSSNADPQLTNYISYVMVELLVWQGLGDIINRFRDKCLRLDPVSLIWAPGMLQRLKVPHTYCWSPALIPKPKDWAPHISISGFYLLNLATDYTPTPTLQAFLDAGDPPVYIGFGSIVLEDPNAMTELIFEAARSTGQRILLSKGWGGMGADELHVPDNVFMLGNVPHDWLFSQVSCVVHHGGAGTTAAGITAGRPTLVVPFFGDQPFWGAMVARAGAGPNPIPHKQLTAEKLADAINFCLKPESLQRAEELASRIAAERGTDVGAQSFHQFLDVDRLRCSLDPSRSAAWRIRRTNVRLSPFAACTLANANLLDFNDLKLYRPREYDTDEGPSDPISGFGTAAFGTLVSMSMGVASMPTEAVRGILKPFASSRHKSQASGSTSAGIESQATSNPSVSLSRNISGPSNSHRSIRSSSSSISEASEAQSISSKTIKTSKNPFTRHNTSPGKDRNLHENGIYGSKGLGGIVKSAFKSPMEMTMGITKGFHNAPKMWGDDTVRPQPKVSGAKSGAQAIGKEFAYGMYDGVTGLVTQPWNGAKKEGATGFFKGVGKGVGGIIAKPGAALFGIPGYLFQGAYKESQKLFGSNVQDYIVASRTAQGYDDWLHSSEEEKQGVIERWKLIQICLKKKQDPDEMVQGILDVQRKKDTTDREHQNVSRPTTNSSSMGHSDFSEELQVSANDTEPPRRPVHETSRREPEVDANVEWALHENLSHVPSQQIEAADLRGIQRRSLQATDGSAAESRRHAVGEARSMGNQLKRTMVGRPQNGGLQKGDCDDAQFHSARRDLGSRAESCQASSSSSLGSRTLPPYTSGHLVGTTQAEFEARQREQGGEKTAQEKTEEEVVLEYIKKQSLLEESHHGKGKGRVVTATEDEDDEDLQEALKLSMRDAEDDSRYR